MSTGSYFHVLGPDGTILLDSADTDEGTNFGSATGRFWFRIGHDGNISFCK